MEVPHPQHTEPCQRASAKSWAYNEPLHGQMQPLQCAAGVVEPALGIVAGLGGIVGSVVC